MCKKIDEKITLKHKNIFIFLRDQKIITNFVNSKIAI